jgi:ubiquinone/menaquinone biosynthesis C-methylase UbiE
VNTPTANQSPSLDEFKRRDAESYDDVAGEFHALTNRYTTPIANALLDLAKLKPGMRILDIGCGTGVLSLNAALNVPGLKDICGVDLSTGMLDEARKLATEQRVADRIRYLEGDAERLDFPDGSFDAVVSLYALRHFPHPDRALAEMHRVCRPGGVTVVGVGSGPPLLSAGFFSRGFERVHDVLLGMRGLRPLTATAFLDGLIDEHLGHATKEEDAAWTHGATRFDASVSALMNSSGFTGIDVQWFGQSAQIASNEDFWRLQVTLSSRARKRYADSSVEKRTALRNAFDAQCKAHTQRGGLMIYRSGALVTRGIRPNS